MEAYRANPNKVRFPSTKDCHDLFLWEDTRKVDKTGCVKLNGFQYEAGIDFIGKKVDLRFDPFDSSVIEVLHNGVFVRNSHPLIISEFVSKPQIKKN